MATIRFGTHLSIQNNKRSVIEDHNITSYDIEYQLFSPKILQQQTVGLVQSWSFALRAVGQLFDLDRTTLAPARCSQF